MPQNEEKCKREGKTSPTAPTIMHGRGRCPHRPALPRYLSPEGRGDHTLPPGIAPQLMKKPCHCEGAPRPWRSASPAPRFLCLRRLPFFLRQKKGRKERRQNQGFGILFAAEVSSTSVSSYLADRDVQNLQLAFAWSLRRHPLAAHAGPRCPDAAGIRFASAVLCAIFLVIVSQGTMPTSSRPGNAACGGARGPRPT